MELIANTAGRRRLKHLACFILLVAAWLVVEDLLDVRLRLRALMPSTYTTGIIDGPVTFEPCQHLARKLKGIPTKWPEEAALSETPITDHLDVANASLSVMRLVSDNVDISRRNFLTGDTVEVLVTLHDGYGRRVERGGDHVRVWMREKSKGASVIAHVIDNQNGSHTAAFPILWAGEVEIIAVLVRPRQIIETFFRRRYICPPTVLDRAMFSHPKEAITELTPCYTEPQIPGYDVICNLTEENYGMPWYCGKPKNKRMLCSDWAAIYDRNLWLNGLETNLTEAEKFLLNPTNKANHLPDIIHLTVEPGNKSSHYVANRKCCDVKATETWNRTSPLGYFYKKRWINLMCRGPENDSYVKTCLSKTRILLIGDSTLRQWHVSIQAKVPCEFVTDTWSVSGKHREVTCYNSDLDFTLTWAPHGLPFSTHTTPRHYLKPFRAYFGEIDDTSRVILVLHIYAHYLSYHSSVFQNVLQANVQAIGNLMKRNPNVVVAIKGPHSWAFERADYQSLWMLDKYAEIYGDIIQKVLSPLSDRIIYIDSLEMTKAAENNHIHAEDYVINELVDQLLYHACQF